jgi:hypothetical protein
MLKSLRNARGHILNIDSFFANRGDATNIFESAPLGSHVILEKIMYPANVLELTPPPPVNFLR